MDRERNFNILRGIILGSYLKNNEKKELLVFVNNLESQSDCECDSCDEKSNK